MRSNVTADTMKIKGPGAVQPSPDDMAAIDAWSRSLFDPEELALEWAEPDYRVLVRCDGKLAAHVAVVARDITAGGTPVRVGGIGSVMTPPEWQGKGLARTAMHAAADLMRDAIGAEFGFLLCSEALVRYYSRLGWQRVEAPVQFRRSAGTETWHEEAMVLPFGNRQWPAGIIDLCGLPW